MKNHKNQLSQDLITPKGLIDKHTVADKLQIINMSQISFSI